MPPVRLNGRLNWSLTFGCDTGQPAQRQNFWSVCVVESELAVHRQRDVDGEWDSRADQAYAPEADPGQNYVLASVWDYDIDNDIHAIPSQFIFK